MFATLLGALRSAGSDRPGLDEIVSTQQAAGLEPISDGTVWAGDGDPVERWLAASRAADVAVKAAIVGPWTRAPSVPDPAATADLRRVVLDLAAAGCPLVEVHEPRAVDLGPADIPSFLEAHHRLVDGVAGTHLSLAFTGGDVDVIGPGLFELPYASFGFDLRRGPENWRLIAEAPGDRGIVVGAIPVEEGSDDGPELPAWAVHYAASLGGRGLARVGLGPAGSLSHLTWEAAVRKLAALGAAARIAALETFDEMAPHLDPRAVGMKSAAFGRYVPPRKPRGR